jgi:hypothetical protein
MLGSGVFPVNRDPPLAVRIYAPPCHEAKSRGLCTVHLRPRVTKRHIPATRRATTGDELQLVIELIPTGDGIVGGYYFVYPNNRCLFWLDEFCSQAPV